jgi:myo-inositol-1(or 4)-monophosphatase
MTILEVAIKAAVKAGKFVLGKSPKKLEITEKGINDIVTSADKESERLIIREIKKNFKDAAFLAEESTENPEKIDKSYANSKYIWIIDPIDGTTNFVHNIPIYGISIAVFETKAAKSSKNYNYLAGELIAGVVYIPKLNELFYAEKGKGAYLNNKKIHVSNTKKLEKSLLVTGFPRIKKQLFAPHFNKLLTKSGAIRQLGAASVNLCYVADGRIDAYWEYGLKPWDIAAGVLIIEEAGGKVTDTNGNLLDLFGKDMLASNKKIHKELTENLNMRS